MALRYTTEEAVFNRLRGRLTSDSVFTQGTVDVDPQLIEQVGGQVESRVDAQLSAIYQMPLTLTNTRDRQLMASIVEKLVCCELLPIYYPAPLDDGGGNFDNYARMMCKAGNQELKELIDSVITLDGETPIGGENMLLSTNVTIAGRRTDVTGRQDARSIKW